MVGFSGRLDKSDSVKAFEEFKETNPDAIVRLGFDPVFSDEQIHEIFDISKSYWCALNVSEEKAILSTLKVYVKGK